MFTKRFQLIFAIGIVISGLSISWAQHFIYTPRIVDFGQWGNWEYCPTGQFVNGFQLQTEQPQGEFKDDTALNSIKFFCGPIGNSVNELNFITSKQGFWGNWGRVFPCLDNSTAIGIQLKVERSQNILDDTGANNLRMICSDRLIHEGDGTLWGKWLTKSVCPRKMAVCGLRTMVENWTDNDDTALDSIDIACCEIPSPAKSCSPKERWEFVALCDNSVGQEAKECAFESKDSQPNFWADVDAMSKTYTELGMRPEENYVDLINTLQSQLGKSRRTGFDWRSFGGSLNSRKTKMTLKADPGERRYLYRLRARCGIYHLNTEYYQIFNEELSPKLTSFDYQ